MPFPTKEERAKCWGARDVYWQCLDENKISESEPVRGRGKSTPCDKLRKMYEQSCSAQWVKHFDRKRNYIQFKNRMETEGFEPLDENRKEQKAT